MARLQSGANQTWPSLLFSVALCGREVISALRFVKTNVARKHPDRVPFGTVQDRLHSAGGSLRIYCCGVSRFWSNAITSTAETPLRYRPIFQMDFI